jgi:hypothetical protein
VSEFVLRVRADDREAARHIKYAVKRMYDIYGPGKTDCVSTANVILESNVESTYSLFFGQDYSGTLGARDYNMSPVVTLGNAGDWRLVPVGLGPENFEEIFNRIHVTSDVHVNQIVNHIYIFRRWMSDYERDKTVGRKLTLLY